MAKIDSAELGMNKTGTCGAVSPMKSTERLVLAEASLIQGGITVNVKVTRVEPARQWARACTRLITMSTK